MLNLSNLFSLNRVLTKNELQREKAQSAARRRTRGASSKGVPLAGSRLRIAALPAPRPEHQP